MSAERLHDGRTSTPNPTASHGHKPVWMGNTFQKQAHHTCSPPSPGCCKLWPSGLLRVLLHTCSPCGQHHQPRAGLQHGRVLLLVNVRRHCNAAAAASAGVPPCLCFQGIPPMLDAQLLQDPRIVMAYARVIWALEKNPIDRLRIEYWFGHVEAIRHNTDKMSAAILAMRTHIVELAEPLKRIVRPLVQKGRFKVRQIRFGSDAGRKWGRLHAPRDHGRSCEGGGRSCTQRSMSVHGKHDMHCPRSCTGSDMPCWGRKAACLPAPTFLLHG